MSTSTVSEGKIREYFQREEKVPLGWLFDKDWNSVHDPKQFYANPKTAFLGPLGGIDFGYKGFALGLIVEIFAGIMTGGGYSQANPGDINNSAFFLTFSLELLGESVEIFQEKVTDLVDYINTSSKDQDIRIPGWARDYNLMIDENQKLSIDDNLYKDLERLLEK